MFVEANTDEVNNIGVVEFRHDDGLHQEIHLCLIGRQFRQRLHQQSTNIEGISTGTSNNIIFI